MTEEKETAGLGLPEMKTEEAPTPPGPSFTPWEPPSDLDSEVLLLCTALNMIPGIRTFESCFGHGKNPLRIWFHSAAESSLVVVAYASAWCHAGVQGWKVLAETDCSLNGIRYVLESNSVGCLAEREANRVALSIKETLESERSD